MKIEIKKKEEKNPVKNIIRLRKRMNKEKKNEE